MKLKPKVSVIIPVFNGQNTIEQCLDSVDRSNFSPFEVIVVNDASTDDTLEKIKPFDCHVKSLPQNVGPAQARNVGVEISKGDILFFLDADMLIEPDTIERISESMNDDPTISAVFGSFQKETPIKNIISKYKNLIHHFTHQISNEAAATFCGGFGAIRRTVFTDMGGFNPNYRYLEDIELGHRLYNAGHCILLNKDIQLTHLKTYSFLSLIKSDIIGRAIPWTKLMLKNRIFRNDLNTRLENIISVPLSYLFIGFIPLSFFWPAGWFFLWFYLLLFLILNFRFLDFVQKEKGWDFFVKSTLLLWIGYIYSGVGFVIGLFSYLLELAKRETK